MVLLSVASGFPLVGVNNGKVLPRLPSLLAIAVAAVEFSVKGALALSGAAFCTRKEISCLWTSVTAVPLRWRWGEGLSVREVE